MIDVSKDTQAALLLTAILSKLPDDSFKPLSTSEWHRFYLKLKERGNRPGDLLTGNTSELLHDWDDPHLPLQRIITLLGRGMALGLALEKWQRTGIWVLGNLDAEYPKRLAERLKEQTPPLLFGCGNRRLLNIGGIAVVGSRNASDEDLEFTRSLARKLANSGKTIISGGARGIDEAAMTAALEAEGTSVGVLADGLMQAIVSKKYRAGIKSRDLVLVSSYNPESGFNVGNAMARNKYIYALSDAAVAVHAGTTGGTWNGALENLKKGWVPLWVKRTADEHAGNAGIVQKGARWFTKEFFASEPLTSDNNQPSIALETSKRTERQVVRDDQALYREILPQAPGKGLEIKDKKRSSWQDISLYEMFCFKLKHLLADHALSQNDLAEQLDLTSAQLQVWLKQAMSDGLITKINKPVRYQLTTTNNYTQLYLFEE